MATLQARDKKLIWHPFTQEKTASDVLAIKRAKGSYVYDEQDKPYLDLISSWWVNLHGHANAEIAESLYEQAQKLEHIIFGGFTHEPAVLLCEGLAELLPAELSRFFFSDNGSTAVEVALKMAYQYWQNQGQNHKKLFLSFDGGYHGDTFGAMSVGHGSGFHNSFSSLLFNVLSIPFPETWDDDANVEPKEKKALEALQQYLQENGNNIAALILEPLVQGAGGMRMCRPSFIKTVVEEVRKFGILVIFDEVMTGFGRTGSTFAFFQTDVIPDFICISKGITGGFLPLALTVTSPTIYQAFLHDEWKYAFAHGHSYTANPLACAAAITSLEILQREQTQSAIKALNQSHREGLDYLKESLPHIKRIRLRGTIAAFNIDISTEALQKLKALFLDNGLLIRPLGNTIYMIPPYSTTQQELETAYEKIADCFQKLGL